MAIEITYSFWAHSFKDQLKKHGLKYSKFEVKLIQKLTVANLNLKSHEIISLTEAESIQLEIHYKLLDHLELYNEGERFDIDYETEFL